MKWHEMTSPQVAELSGTDPVAILPVAAIEQHGPHLPLSTDVEIGHGLVGASATRLHDVPHVVLPMQALGTSPEHLSFPGTLTLAPDSLGDTLVDVREALAISETLEIPSPIPGVDDIVLNLETNIHSLVFTPDGGRLGLGTRVDGVKKVPHTILGAIARGSCLKGYPVQWDLPGTSSFELALYDDFLNLALAAVWHGGALQMQLGPEEMGELLGDDGASGLPLPVDDLALRLDWSLPPIINGCDPGGILTIQVGDLLVDLDMYSPLFAPEGVGKLALYAALEVTAEILMIEGDEGDELAIQIHDITRFDVDWVTVPELLLGAEDSLEVLIETELIGDLVEDLAGEPIGAFQIPEIDLASVSPMVPEGVVIEPSVETLEREGGHTLMTGYLK